MTTQRFILTGTPGSGKTTLLQELDRRGYTIIPEAATDVIAHEQKNGSIKPWEDPAFIDKIIILQKNRQIASQKNLQFYDRSPFCTYALAHYLHYPFSEILLTEIHRCLQEKVYQPQIFFLENLGYIESTSARQISFEEAIIFEKIHLDVYKKFGFEIVFVPPVPLQERCEFILETL